MPDDTPTRLMDAAEILFAEHGVDAVSFRQLATRAQANVAAVHYHFGSKPALLEAVLLRRMGALWERRAVLLRALEQCGRAPTAADWVDLVLVPLRELIDQEGTQGRAYVRLMWRRQNEDPDGAEHLARTHLGDSARRMNRLLEQLLPGLSPRERRQRGLLCARLVFDVLANEPPGAIDLAGLRRFLCAGLSAPAAQ